jgi:hypothetical protein
MLNGSLPFGEDMPENPSQGFLATLHYVPSFHHNPMVPIWIDGALKKATSITPQLRYDDLSEFVYDLNTPNPDFIRTEDSIPLLQRNPLRFWQSLAAILVVINMILLYLMASRLD